MGRRYYCDYCDRSFIDDHESRKKHLNGSAHLRMRKEYYASFKDPKTILEEEVIKIPCKRFLTDSCMFGVSCRFSHYTQEQLRELKRKVEEEEEDKKRNQSSGNLDYNPSLITWLENQTTGKDPKGKIIGIHENQGFICDLPIELQHAQYLPPSLQRPNILQFLSMNTFSEWG